MAQKITPNLWFDGNAKEAADFYVQAFPDTSIDDVSYYPKTTEEGLADFQTDLAGKELTVEFTVGGLRFTGINAGPEFKPNPSISFFVNFDPSGDDQARAHLDELWGKLTDGGKVLMELGEYPYSKHYGWVEDRYGLSWQLMLTNPDGEPRPFITPSLMFTKDNIGKAEEALTFYASLFKDSQTGNLAHYPEDSGPAVASALMYGDVQLDGQWFAGMDAGTEQDFTFNNGISLSIACKDQPEIDYFWDKLSTNPAAEQCGWCQDKYGVSWQVVPQNMGELMQRPNAFANMMQMKKLVIADF